MSDRENTEDNVIGKDVFRQRRAQVLAEQQEAKAMYDAFIDSHHDIIGPFLEGLEDELDANVNVYDIKPEEFKNSLYGINVPIERAVVPKSDWEDMVAAFIRDLEKANPNIRDVFEQAMDDSFDDETIHNAPDFIESAGYSLITMLPIYNRIQDYMAKHYPDFGIGPYLETRGPAIVLGFCIVVPEELGMTVYEALRTREKPKPPAKELPKYTPS